MAPNIVTVTEDTDNKFGWTTITLTHDGFGTLLGSDMLLDSGALHSRLYTDGVLRTLTVTDSDANSANWSLRTTEWDATGAKTGRITIKDTGTRIVEAYDPLSGKRVERSEFDDGNDEVWRSKSVFYDADTGARIATDKVMNNGWVYQESFDIDTGARATKTTIDAADKRNWEQIDLSFDLATGEVTSRTWTYDSGMTQRYGYENSKLTSHLKTDVTDLTNWSTRSLAYDAQGKVAARQVIYDDGSEYSETRVNGMRSESIHTDGEGAADSFDWKTRTESFHDNGRIATRTDLMDDSDEIRTTYRQDKTLASATTTDHSGNEVWHVEQSTYDAEGALIGTEYFDAFGDVLIF